MTAVTGLTGVASGGDVTCHPAEGLTGCCSNGTPVFECPKALGEDCFVLKSVLWCEDWLLPETLLDGRATVSLTLVPEEGEL